MKVLGGLVPFRSWEGESLMSPWLASSLWYSSPSAPSPESLPSSLTWCSPHGVYAYVSVSSFYKDIDILN